MLLKEVSEPALRELAQTMTKSPLPSIATAGSV